MNYNEQQLQAINSQAKSLLVVAGPGSGKTSVIVARIVRLLAEGSSPYDFLVITFTRKAAQQLRERLEKALEGQNVDTKKMTICTSHAFCLRIIRQWAEKIGYNENLVIYDEIDQKDIITAIIKDLGYKISTTKAIEQVKDMITKPLTECIDVSREIFLIGKEYLAQLQKYNALDYDLILAKAVYILQTFPEALQYYQSRYTHLFYDEFQDIAELENRLCLSLMIPNSFVVGDISQNIYSWRGTDIKHIMDYQTTYPDCEVLKLEYNYRSRPDICQAANNLIRHNKQRADTEIIPTREAIEDTINVFSSQDEYNLFMIVASHIKSQIGRGILPQDIAILVRTNRQLNPFKIALETQDIPVQLVARDNFWQRPEIKDVLAFMRVIANPKDDFSMEIILKMSYLNISRKFQLEIKQRTIQNDSSLAYELYKAEKTDLYVIASFPNKKALDAYNWVINESGYVKSLQDQYLITKSAAVQSMLKRIQDWIDASGDESLNGFLESISLISAIDSWDEKKDAVALMTIHCAKGLEWPTVFVIGCSEGLMPLPCKDEATMEEERRLFYVALTRAKERLLLGYNTERFLWKKVCSQPSRFINEIKNEIPITLPTPAI